MDKLSDVKVFLVARDKATNHLRIESRALKFDEVPDYIRKHVIPTANEYTWTIDYKCPDSDQKQAIEGIARAQTQS